MRPAEKGKVAMKNTLVNLLIAISLGLCALITVQWHREGKAREKAQKLTDTIYNRDERIQTFQGDVKRLEAEVVRLDKLKNDLTETVKTNKLDLARLVKDIERANGETERQLKQVDKYKEALESVNAAITKQNEDVKRQNEDLKQLAAERNDSVQKYNKVVAEFNDLAKKWNQVQETLSKMGTNAPAVK